MMKLSLMKDLFDTVNSDWDCDFAEPLIENWSHDKNWIKILRASANFVCVFKSNEKYFIVRFNNDSERNIEEIKGEINLLNYLNSKNILIATPVSSTKGNYIEKTITPLGIFYSVVFEKIIGTHNEINELNINDFFLWGKALGQLHQTIKNIPENLKINRKTHEELFENFVAKIPTNDKFGKNEIENIREIFKSLPKM